MSPNYARGFSRIAIEENSFLQIIAWRTFLHSLDPERTSRTVAIQERAATTGDFRMEKGGSLPALACLPCGEPAGRDVR